MRLAQWPILPERLQYTAHGVADNISHADQTAQMWKKCQRDTDRQTGPARALSTCGSRCGGYVPIVSKLRAMPAAIVPASGRRASAEGGGLELTKPKRPERQCV